MAGYAARFSNDIARDFARGFSFGGWGFTPAATEGAALDAAREYGYADPEVAFSEDAGGYLPILAGLSAYYDADEARAIESARRDERFSGVALWVFPAEYLGQDEDSGAALVRPTGEATRVS